MSVGPANSLQTFREVFICLVEVLEYCSNSLWFPFPRPCQDALISRGLVRASSLTGPPFGSALVAAKGPSGVADPPHKDGCDLPI